MAHGRGLTIIIRLWVYAKGPPLRVRKGWYLSRFAGVIICLACERYHVSRVNLRGRHDTFRVNLRGTYHTSRVKFCARGIMTPAYAKDLNFWNVRVLNLSHCEQHDHSRTMRTLGQLLFPNIIYVENGAIRCGRVDLRVTYFTMNPPNPTKSCVKSWYLFFSNIIYVENVKMVPFDAEGSIYISNSWVHNFYYVIPDANVKDTIPFALRNGWSLPHCEVVEVSRRIVRQLKCLTMWEIRMSHEIAGYFNCLTM